MLYLSGRKEDETEKRSEEGKNLLAFFFFFFFFSEGNTLQKLHEAQPPGMSYV